MPNRVKRKVRHSVGNWIALISDLRTRLSFHEEKTKELRALIADLETARDDGIAFPGEFGPGSPSPRSATHN